MALFDKFEFESIPLEQVFLDFKNPRLVVPEPLTTEDEIIEYLFEYEDLSDFISKVANQGKNKGAERPYIIGAAPHYTVVEGNTRIAAYKLLTGQAKASDHYSDKVPTIPEALRTSLLVVDCAIAPNRDTLLPIMADSHFGTGDKSKWGYLGSRKAVNDEYVGGRTIAQLAKAFRRTKSEITDYLIEYRLYEMAIKLPWTAAELEVLTNPGVMFNPPVRFLQTSGHKEKTGISFDRTNIAIKVADNKKFQHLIRKLVVDPGNGLGATSTYDAVFADFDVKPVADTSDKSKPANSAPVNPSDDDLNDKPPKSEGPSKGKYALFGYKVTRDSLLLAQLMKEAKAINSNTLPGSSALLIRTIVEAILKDEIHLQDANPSQKSLSLESALDLVQNKKLFSVDDRKILKEFKKSHVEYLNLAAHGHMAPDRVRVMSVRDAIDQFIKRVI